ncbi:EamA family transporter [bacterium]|nr:EamA family transporter [bacterium]
MNWLFFAIAAYFLLALSYVLDKFLLADRIPKPAVYAFYVALLSAASLTLIPFGFYWQGIYWMALSLLSGVIFIYALLFYYQALKRNEVSRVAPLIGSIVPTATFLIAAVFLNERLTVENLGGFIFLVGGGFLISFDLPLRSRKIFKGFYYSLASGILFAIAYSFFKYVYGNGEFINGFIWTRLGLLAGGLSLFAFPAFRKSIVSSFRGLFKRSKKIRRRRNMATIALFILNKIFGGSSSILVNYAIFLGSVSLVQAVSSLQFVFVLMLVAAVSVRYPRMFNEKLYFWDWAQKIGAVVMIAAGIGLLAA